MWRNGGRDEERGETRRKGKDGSRGRGGGSGEGQRSGGEGCGVRGEDIRAGEEVTGKRKGGFERIRRERTQGQEDEWEERKRRAGEEWR